VQVEGTYLDNLVPSARNDYRIQDVRAESYAGYPNMETLESIGIKKVLQHTPLRVTILFDVIFALSQSIPELD